MSEQDLADARGSAREAFARSATGNPLLTLHRASMDAGFRSYWRGDNHGTSIIVMDSPPDKEDVKPWLSLRDVLESSGVRVPAVLHRDVDNGFLILEDLGADTMLQAFDNGALQPDQWFPRAVDQWLKLQVVPVDPALPRYDTELLARELRLFDEWFVGTHLGHNVSCADMESLESVYQQLITQILAQPQGFVHRDFMPRNLMPIGDQLAVLDFQDAVLGPIAYDALTLFKDAFISWPADFVNQQWREMHARALEQGVPVSASFEQFERDLDYIGIQRHLKVIGIFARLCHRDAKPKYVADAPRFVRYLDEVLPKYPELSPLREFIDRVVKPSLNAGA